MQVIKEVWVLRHHTHNTYKCAQNTATPRLFASEATAVSSAAYDVRHSNGILEAHLPVRAYIVIDDEVQENKGGTNENTSDTGLSN